MLFKVPATAEGIPAIEQLISEGINVNITLMFSLRRNTRRWPRPISMAWSAWRAPEEYFRVASVASFFVSRVDTAVDARLANIGAEDLLGHIAVANAKMAYVRFRAMLGTQRWLTLSRASTPQRPLWASTSAKNARYADTLYVDNLIGPTTVNTMPLATLHAFLDHGVIAPRVEMGWDKAQFELARLADLGVDLATITEQLTEDGVKPPNLTIIRWARSPRKWRWPGDNAPPDAGILSSGDGEKKHKAFSYIGKTITSLSQAWKACEVQEVWE